jgi:xylitol oxidase
MREHNWAENYSFAAARILRPETIDEVRRIVAAAPKLRAIGTRHSFNGIADTTGDIIDLGSLEPGFVVDPDRLTVTLGANTSYGTLATYLQTQGYALHNMGSLPHISVVGAMATGTHGSGDRNGSLATAVCGLELVVADGDLVHLRRGDDGFDGMVVGLGAFGVVTRVTLDIQPGYQMRQDEFVDLPWEALLSDFDAVSSAAYSVSILTKWGDPAVSRLWLKTRLDDGVPADLVTAAHLGARPAPADMIPRPLDGPRLFDGPGALLTQFGGVAGPWSERLPHFRPEAEPGVRDQIQSEYMLPRPQIVPALTALRALASRIDPHLHMTEIRTMAADDLWLSPSYGHDTVAIHFTWHRKPAEVAAITSDIETILLPLGGRPHWGKLIHADAAQLAPLYPRMEAFRALVGRYDPTGKFRNAYLDRHVFG